MKKFDSELPIDFPLSITNSNKENDEDLMIDLSKNNLNLDKFYSNSIKTVPKEIKNILGISGLIKKGWTIKYVISVLMREKKMMISSNAQLVISKLIIVKIFSSTHRWCYGSELIREYENFKEWTCQKCQYINKNPHKAETIRCIFCPFNVGIIKKVDEIEWAHIVCVNWDESIQYLDATKEKINYKYIDKEKFSLRCMFCKIRQGACIQCDVTSCSKSFHVICAIQKGLIKHWKKMELQRSLKEDEKINIYCQVHNFRTIPNKKSELKKVEVITAKKSVVNLITPKKFNKHENLKNMKPDKNFPIIKEKQEQKHNKDNSTSDLIKFDVNESNLPIAKCEKKYNIESQIIDLTDNNEDETQFLKKKIPRKEEKVLVKADLGRILGIYYPITYEQLLIEINKYLKNNRLLDKKEQYIYVQKNEKLKELLKCEVLSYSLLYSKIEEFVEKIDYNKQIIENIKKKEDYLIINVNKSSTENKETKLENKQKDINCEISIKTIHSNEIIKKRAFFMKENSLKLFKF